MNPGDELIVLDYHDSLIRLSDLKSLDSTNWLNDKIIGAYVAI